MEVLLIMLFPFTCKSECSILKAVVGVAWEKHHIVWFTHMCVFVLCSFSSWQIWSCALSAFVMWFHLLLQLLKLLEGLSSPVEGGVGIGLDSCVMPTRHKGFFLVQTTDLYPPHHQLHCYVIEALHWGFKLSVVRLSISE